VHESIIANLTIEELEVHFSINDSDPFAKRLFELVTEIKVERDDLSDELESERCNLGEKIEELEEEVGRLEEVIEELEDES